MNPKKQTPPPRWAERLLEWFCPMETLEEVLGDLAELYAYWIETQGKRTADRRYALSAVRLLRPFTKRKTSTYSSPFFTTSMLHNYFITAWRSLTHNKSYTAINITGMTLSLTCCLLLCVVITHELSYDAYHTQADRIYRVQTLKIEPESTDAYSGAPLGVAAALRTDFPEIEKVTTLNVHESRLLSLGDQPGKASKYKETIAFADPYFFNLFDYRVVAGNPRKAMLEPNTVVLTEKYAEKYFGQLAADQIIGQILTLDNLVNLKVSGIVENPPSNTNFPFNLLISFATQKSLDKNFNPNEWGGWSDNAQTYVLLSEGANRQTIESRFPQMWEKYHGGGISQRRGSTLVALKELHFHGNYSGRSVNWQSIYIMGIIGLFLLLTACVNFVNLATAQAIKRSKEVGIRKVLGSSRAQLVLQFMAETSILTLVALFLAVGLSLLSLPSLSVLLDIPLSAQFLLHPVVVLFLFSTFLVVSFLSGFYPAFVLSSFGAVKAIKNKFTSSRAGSSSFTKSMLVLQFTTSLVFMIGTTIVARQTDLFKNADLGFDKESIVTLPLPAQDTNKLSYLRSQLMRLAEVEQVSFSFNSASAESNMMGELSYQNPGGEEIKIRTQFKLADANFIPTYGIRLLAGTNLPDVDSTPQIIINEVFMKRMGIDEPQAAMGKIIKNGEEQLQIVGVAADFHVNSLHQKIDPTIIGINPSYFFQANIKLASSEASLKKALAHIEQVWRAAFPEEIYTYQLLDETLNEAYWQETRTFYLLNIFSVIALFVSCLGIYGLISFIALQRTKEIGVRKVLGASVPQIVGLLSKDFLKLILLAFIIASPIAWYTMNKWLEDFEYRIGIGTDVFLAAGGVAIAISMLTISFQAIKAALVNPVKTLRTE